MNGPNIRKPRTAGEWHPSRMDAIEHYKTGDGWAAWIPVVVIIVLAILGAVHIASRL